MLRQNKNEVAEFAAKERMEENNMDWNTIYITGKNGFKREVSKRLESSDVNYMPGYIGAGAKDHDMYWLDKHVSLRAFKEAITAKTIWKYRIRFYVSLDEFIASQKKESDLVLTKQDLDLINVMRKAS